VNQTGIFHKKINFLYPSQNFAKTILQKIDFFEKNSRKIHLSQKMSSQFSAVTFNDVIFNEVTFNEVTFNEVTFNEVIFEQLTQDQVTFNEVTFNEVIFEQLTQDQLHHQKYADELYDEVLEMVEIFEREMSEIRETLKGEPQNREFLNHRLHLTNAKLIFYKGVISLDLQTALMMKDKHFEVSTEYLMFLSENVQCENDYLNECDLEKQFHEGCLFLIEKVELMTDPDLDDEFKYMPVVFRKRESKRISAH
jgi:hypothetical protein